MRSHCPVTWDQSTEAPPSWGWWAPDEGLASTGPVPLPELSAMCKLTAAFLPCQGLLGHRTQGEGAGAPQCQFWGRWPHEKAPSHPLPTPFSRLCYDKCTPFTLSSWRGLKKDGSTPPNIEDSFRVPRLFTGGLREFAGLLSLRPVLLGSPRERFFWS